MNSSAVLNFRSRSHSQTCIHGNSEAVYSASVFYHSRGLSFISKVLYVDRLYVIAIGSCKTIITKYSHFENITCIHSYKEAIKVIETNNKVVVIETTDIYFDSIDIMKYNINRFDVSKTICFS